jgi:hypothetical protein
MNKFIVDKLSIAFLSYLFVFRFYIHLYDWFKPRTAQLVFAAVAISMQH